MYIEPFWIAVIAIVIIYLAWRVAILKNVIAGLDNIINTYRAKKESLDRDLVRTLIYFDSKYIHKLSEKNRDKILKEQAEELRCHFKNNYVEPMYLNGKIVPIEDEPMFRLGACILDTPVLDSDKPELNITVDDTIEDIKIGLEAQIEQFD